MLAILTKCMIDPAGAVVEDGVILVENGKILDAGRRTGIPDGARIVDARGLWVTPGLIEAHAHAAAEMDDLNELTTQFTPDCRAFDAIDPYMEDIPVMRRAGFTTVCVLPGSGNLVGGSGVVIKIKPGHTVFDLAVYNREPLKMALGENPVMIYGGRRKTPMTRMGELALIRRMFIRADNYRKEREADKAQPDPELEPLCAALRREKRVRIHCHRSEDLVSAVRLGQEFGLDVVLEHATQGERVADWLASQNVPCVVGPLMLEHYKREVEGCGPHVPGILEKAGVRFALTMDDNRGVMYLPLIAGRCTALGLSRAAAYRSLTAEAARILQIEDRTGAIRPGLDADLAFFNGDPLCNTTRCIGTMIDGTFCDMDFQENKDACDH